MNTGTDYYFDPTTVSHWKYTIGIVIVYRDVYRASRDLEQRLENTAGTASNFPAARHSGAMR